MSDSIIIEGREYLSSKRAAEISGYAQDYIGQLARGGHIDAQRVGGLWYVSLSGLESYKSKSENFKPMPPLRREVQRAADAEALITFDGKDYISSVRAAKITGYNHDYIGQLARSGKINSRNIGNRWYIERESLLEHKNEKDRLLGAVQAESVGLHRKVADVSDDYTPFAYTTSIMDYKRDSRDLIPDVHKGRRSVNTTKSEFEYTEYFDRQSKKIPIKVLKTSSRAYYEDDHEPEVRSRRAYTAPVLLGGAVLTIIIVATFGYTYIKGSPTMVIRAVAQNASLGALPEILTSLGNSLEKIVVPEVSYKRTD